MSGVKVNFSATDAGFTSTVSKVNSSMKGMDNNVKSVSGSVKASFASMAKAGAALAVGFGAIKGAINAIRGTFDTFKDALDLGGELSDLSARTGETAGNLLVLQRAFQNSGAGAEKVGPSINKLQRAIVEAGQGVITYQRAFSALGLNLEELKYKAPINQLEDVAAAINAIENPTERAAVAMQLLGRSGGELLPFLTNIKDEVKNARDELGTMPDVMDKNASAFDRISDKLNVVKGKSMELASGILESVLPAFNKFIGAGSELDAAGFGREIGQRLSEAFSLITSGDMWELFKLHAEKSLYEIQKSPAMNSFAAFLNTVFDGITDTGQGFDFDKSFEKYKNAGIAANNDLLDDLDAGIAEIGKRQAERTKEAADRIAREIQEAAANSAIMLKDIKQASGFTIESFTTEVPEMLRRVSDSSEKTRRDSKETRDNMKIGASAMKEAASATDKMASTSERLAASLEQAKKQEAIDRGGKQQAKFSEALGLGNFRGAERALGRIQRNEERAEQNQAINQAFNTDKNGDARAFGKSLQDIAKQEGIDTFGKTSRDLRRELAERAKQRQKDMPPGQGGKEGGKGGQPVKDDPMQTISKAVEEIRNLVKKIEPKLPTAALAN